MQATKRNRKTSLFKCMNMPITFKLILLRTQLTSFLIKVKVKAPGSKLSVYWSLRIFECRHIVKNLPALYKMFQASSDKIDD